MAKKVKELLELSQCCAVLNMTEGEINYLVRTRAIPHRVEADGRLTFTEWEILSRVIPKPTSEAMGKPQVDVSAMTKEEIMDVFAAVLQAKAAEEEKELKKTAPAEVEEPPAETVYPEVKEKKEEVPEVADAGPETVTQEKAEPEKKEEKKKETKPKKETAAKPPAAQPKK
ncbi:hypothetical protein LCGC14_0831440 [marine sediment metagenome]|uniref:Uncharacterized protein n=1 Tax=marine sediment metagenome TaxID=412755 RepID=A0A0F9PFR6_9ZZZZ|nr:hypothetical protein [bacterium]